MALRRRARDARSELFPGFDDVVEIGVGSIATVFRAREQGTNRQVALKLLNIRDVSPRALESFQRESVALGALSSHPNIVTLYRSFQTPDGRPVLVLELCVGSVGDAVSHAARGGAGLPVPEAVSIGIKTAAALETAHLGGILHRDVKPQNILVTEFGEPALADFGVAMLQSSTQTTAGLFDFTTLHAAPELLEGGTTSAATDVYELASTLYQLIAGQSAFRAYDGESPASVILRILRDPVRPVHAVGVPVALSDLLIWAMSKDKDQRPPTAAEFARELAQIERAQGWPPTPFLIREEPWSAVTVTEAGTPRPMRQPAGDAPVPHQPSVPPLVVPAEPRLPPAPRPAPVPDPPPAPPTVEPPAPPVGSPPPAPPMPYRSIDPPPFYPPGVEADGASQPSEPPSPTERPRAPAAPAQFPVPPAASADEPSLEPRPEPGQLPVSALRVQPPPPAAVPDAASGELPIDPASLHRRMRWRSGGSSLVADQARLSMRVWLRRGYVPWTDVLGFEPRFDQGSNGTQRGWLVVVTPQGRFDLPATRRPIAELRHIHALLDAYRLRAEQVRRG